MIYTKNNNYELHLGLMQDVLLELPAESVDAIVTDPPYELGFMGKSWDNTGVAFQKTTWEECLRVLKPGGYLLAFGGTRTFHRIACAIEDAGFEIRDTIMWLYGSGFPKSLNIGLAIDKKNGVESEVIGSKKQTGAKFKLTQQLIDNGGFNDPERKEFEIKQAQNEWAGWGTALKPAYEPIIVARKPFSGSLVDNVLEYRVGGLNIDECRVEFNNGEVNRSIAIYQRGVPQKGNNGWEHVNRGAHFDEETMKSMQLGRFPANVIHDGSEEVVSGMPYTKNSERGEQYNKDTAYTNTYTPAKAMYSADNTYGDEGNASRYFYCAKASKRDRDEGLYAFEEIDGGTYQFREDGSLDGKIPARRNIHPTVKPVALMQYLIRLVCPKGSIILDPFNGSGSTGKAVMYENKDRNAGYYYIGVEMTKEYLPISKARLDFAINDTETLDYDVVVTDNDAVQVKRQTKVSLW